MPRALLGLAVYGLLGSAGLAASPSIEACTACHGAGTSGTEGVPSLGGMPATYVTNQLFMFREGQRKAEPMAGIAAPMTDDDLQTYAAAIATLPAPVYRGEPADPERLARAEISIAKHRCASCHGSDLGGDKQVPRIRAQREEYLATALTTYKTSDRAAFDPQMNEVASELSADEIKDLSYAIARR